MQEFSQLYNLFIVLRTETCSLVVVIVVVPVLVAAILLPSATRLVTCHCCHAGYFTAPDATAADASFARAQAVLGLGIPFSLISKYGYCTLEVGGARTDVDARSAILLVDARSSPSAQSTSKRRISWPFAT
ncbi:hypothetical protein EDB83DRAFT_2322773 [Lactarius deliciosus]|nr:hypothetical protein EDB83DRAFT_2322773 [Lactarius deliciosus]